VGVGGSTERLGGVDGVGGFDGVVVELEEVVAQSPKLDEMEGESVAEPDADAITLEGLGIGETDSVAKIEAVENARGERVASRWGEGVGGFE